MARSALQGNGSGRPSTVAFACIIIVLLVASSYMPAAEAGLLTGSVPAVSARNEHRMILSRRLAQLVEPMGAKSSYGVLAGGSGGSKFGGMGGDGSARGGGSSLGGSSDSGSSSGSLEGSAAGGPQPATTATTLRSVNTGGTVGGKR